MKLLMAVAFAGLLVASAPAGALVTAHTPDGITASIALLTGVGDLVLQPDAAGNLVFGVAIYRNVDGAWSQVPMFATLRVFSVDPVGGEQSLVSQGFQATASGVATITVPASALPTPGMFDVFVTFSALGGNPVPTSHHNVAKNQAIALGQFDVADALDYHGATRVLAV